MKNRLFLLLLIISITVLFSACTNKGGELPTSAGKKDSIGLYPAYVMEGSEKSWGYIDQKGQFIIEPKYQAASDFTSNGLAVVSENGDYILIDKSGHPLMSSQYLHTYDFSQELIVVADESGKSSLIDEKGQILFQTDGGIDKLSCGLAAFSKRVNQGNYLWGYIDAQGKVVIEAKYQWAHAYSKDKAIVQVDKGHYEVIDKAGKLLNEIYCDRVISLSDDIILFSKPYEGSYDKYGYMTVEGEIIFDAVYSEAKDFEDGLAIVNTAESFENGYGVIDLKGEFVMPGVNTQITSLKNGVYAIPKVQDAVYQTTFIPKALLDKTGKQLTEFKYYDLERLDNGLISATDEKNTYLVDDKGKEINSIPKIDGVGSIKALGQLYKLEADNQLYYFTQKGKLIWKSDNTIHLDGGLDVVMKSYRPDRCMLIQYPELVGLADTSVQGQINSQLKELFVGEYKTSAKEGDIYTETFDISYMIEQNKDLLVVHKSGYYYPIGAAHGQPIREDYHINIKNGQLYSLKDLFLEGSNYKERLTEAIKRKIDKANKEHGEQIYSQDIGDFEEYSGFVMTKESLNIYFYPYAIASYAAGFPEFYISYEELGDIINTDGQLWNSFERSNSEDARKAVRQIPSSVRSEIENSIQNYENSMIAAINGNDFTLVEPWLYPESSLYHSQKRLVADLNQRNIKEKLNSYTIEKMEADNLGSVYRVYVTENIGIQYPEKDYADKQFNWVYSLVYNYENQRYQLTYIDNWK